MKFHLREDRPIYQQLVTTIADAIVRGELRPGDRLPSQREVAAEAKVNPNTVQRAFMELERMGWSETRRGEGTFVKVTEEQITRLKEQAAQEAWQQFCGKLTAAGFSNPAIKEWVHSQLGEKGGGGHDSAGQHS